MDKEQIRIQVFLARLPHTESKLNLLYHPSIHSIIINFYSKMFNFPFILLVILFLLHFTVRGKELSNEASLEGDDAINNHQMILNELRALASPDISPTHLDAALSAVEHDLRSGSTNASSELIFRFYENVFTPSDISYHLPFLHAYAQNSDSVLELGTGKNFRASWAFLRGLAEGKRDNITARRKRFMVGVDLLNIPQTERIQQIATEHNIEYHFHQDNDLTLPIAAMYGKFDLTFIDTWHCFGQVMRELAIYPAITRKYLIFHDVNIDGVYGEDIRLGTDLGESVKRTNMSYAEIAIGLRPALNWFTENHSDEWKAVLWTDDVVGLVVLERIKPLSD